MASEAFFDYRTKVTSDSPIIRAAFALAERAHAGQSRGKIDPSIPYIIHPIMAYDLLRYHKVTNELVLAAALLHDVKEDGDRYKNEPPESKLFRNDLAELLTAEGVVDAMDIATEIDGLCRELTNAPTMNGGKRHWQVRHADRLSPNAAMLKIVDQMASVLDNILMEDESFDSDKKRQWNYKALDVVKRAAGDRVSLQFWKDLFHDLFIVSMKIVKAPDLEARERLRNGFNFDRLCREINAPTPEPDEIYTAIHNPDTNSIRKGCTRIHLDGDGKVEGYAILVRPSADRNDERNQATIGLTGRLEASDESRRVTTGTLNVQDGRLIEIHGVKPAVPLDEFCAIAKRSGAMDRSFEQRIRQAIQEHAAMDRGRG